MTHLKQQSVFTFGSLKFSPMLPYLSFSFGSPSMQRRAQLNSFRLLFIGLLYYSGMNTLLTLQVSQPVFLLELMVNVMLEDDLCLCEQQLEAQVSKQLSSTTKATLFYLPLSPSTVRTPNAQIGWLGTTVRESSNVSGSNDSEPFSENKGCIFCEFLQASTIFFFFISLTIIFFYLCDKFDFVNKQSAFMDDKGSNKILKAYQKAQETKPLFGESQDSLQQFPLKCEDSLSPVHNYPLSAIGYLTAKGKWGSENGIAFVVHDNYLFTCASNCYSHQHGEFPHIVFNIFSNRKSRFDTHKVSKVFVPEFYKTLPENERNTYNYALLHIQGDPNMIDRYGRIGINCQQDQRKSNKGECAINKHDSLQLCRWELLQSDLSLVLSGGPLLHKNQAIGLIFRETMDQKPILLRFNDILSNDLAQWVQVPKGSFILQSLQSYEKDLQQLKGMNFEPIDRIDLIRCNLNGVAFSFFSKLPVKDISKLTLGFHQHRLRSQIGDDLIFLKLDKFRNLKLLQLCCHGIGQIGCQILASLSLNNLRHLNLNFNPIGEEGCRHLSSAQWPFLQFLILQKCQINNEGLAFLLKRQKRNLIEVNLKSNIFDNGASKIFQQACLPCIKNVNLSDFTQADFASRDSLCLLFLKSPSWKALTKLQINNIRLGSKGCKLLKQANLALKQLEACSCHIGLVGLKWLCKANMEKLKSLDISDNQIRGLAGLVLSKACFPNITYIRMAEIQFGLRGAKLLFAASWARQADGFYVLKSLYKKSLIHFCEDSLYDSSLQL